MAQLHGRTLLRMLVVRRRAGKATPTLVLGVTVWWLLIFGVITLTAPTPEIAGTTSTAGFAPGHVAFIQTPTRAFWLIPIDRAAYDEHDGVTSGNGGDAATQMRARPGWVVVLHGQVVRVLDVDRAVVQVELLESPNTGGRGWLKADLLRPYTSSP